MARFSCSSVGMALLTQLTAVQTSVQVANHLFQHSAKDSGTHGEIVFVERGPFGQ